MENTSLNNQNIGITFKADCLIGAESALDRFFCKNHYPLLTSLAYRGMLLPLVLFIVVSLFVAGFFVSRKFRKKQ